MKRTLLFAALVSALFTISSCKKDSSEKGNNDNNGSTGTYYFKGTMDGKAVDWEVSDGLAGSAAATSNLQGELIGSVSALLSNNSSLEPQIGFEFTTIDKKANEDKNTVFYAFLTTGGWPYTQSFGNYLDHGKHIVVRYIDASGKTYSSIGTQTNSTFFVTSVVKTAATAEFAAGVKLNITFSCILYPDGGTGNTIQITNGTAVARLENLLN